MKTFYSTRVAAFLMLTAIFASGLTADAFSQIKIMPLGDSITRGVTGSTDGAGYRNDLANLLISEGVLFDFVGSQSDGTGFDPNHEGHDGFRADQILSNINSYLQTANPDVVILHIGTNDISNDQTPESTRDEISSILDAINAFDSDIKIILSSVTPRGDAKDTQTATLNNLIEALFYAKRDDQGRNIFYAGVNELFKQDSDFANNLLDDDVHPNDDGYNLMGKIYFNAIMVAFNSSDTEVTDNFQRTSLGVTWDADPEYVISNGDLSNTATSGGSSWQQMATYKAIKNPTSVSVKWAADASAAGLTEGGLALLLDSPSRNANGYLAWITPNDNELHLWTLQNGGTHQDQLTVNPQSTASPPTAGSVFRVDVSVTESTLQFNYYVNDVFAGSVSKSNPGVTGARYSGIITKHGLDNDVDEFSLKKSTDTTPPAAITNLVANTPSATSITLSWTATGDDGNIGQASSYDIRYSTFGISEGNFDEAVAVNGVPSPSISGASESLVVTGLLPNTLYSFAIKVIDESGNVSAISNAASNTTIAGNLITDDFDRASLGSKWTATPDYAIVDDQLSNTSTLDANWNEVAVYNDRKNPIEVSFTWADDADAPGIDQGGFFVAVGSASTTANGYAITRRNPTNEIRLWEVVGGVVTNLIEKNSSPQLSVAQPGDIIKIQILVEDDGNKFDFFKNGAFDGRVEDSAKIHDLESGDYWAGVVLRGNRNNDLDDFQMLFELGSPSVFAISNGNNQSGAINQELAVPLTVIVTDDAGTPFQGINVNFTVLSGGGSVDVAPPKDDIVLEAENGVLVAPMVSGTDAGASRGGFIQVPDGQGAQSVPGSATFTINISEEADYHIWGRAIYPSAESDAFNVIVAGQTYQWDVGQRIHQTTWHWDAVSHRGSGSAVSPQLDPVVFHFSAGQHTLKFQEAKDGVKLDQIVITKTTSGFQPPADQGTIEAGGTFTDANGQASTKLRLGPTPGTNSVQATALGLTPLVFTATATAGQVTVITKVSGDAQKGDRGTVLSAPFVAEFKDALGNLAANVATTWTVVSGNGTLSQTGTVMTNAQGRAQNTLTLATDVGINQVSVTTAGYTGSPVIFTATANAGAATAIAVQSGNNQTGTAGKPLTTPLKVLVTDDIGTPVPNNNVTFSVTGGGGSVNPASVITGADGTASTSWTLGTNISAVHEVKAVATGVTASATFNATAAIPTSIAPVSALSHQGIAGIPLVDSVKVRVKDSLGNNLPGYPVEFSVITAGGFEQGQINGKTTPVTVSTDLNGIAKVEWRLGSQAGVNNNKLRATATYNDNVLTGAPIEFIASAEIGSASTLVQISGNNQTGMIETALTEPLTVRVTDGNNAVENWVVTFSVTAGGGHFSNGQSTINKITDANGVASATLTLGSTAGTTGNPFNNVVQVVAENNSQPLTGSPITFRASALASAASSLAQVSGNNQTGNAGDPLPQQVKVKVTDASGNGIADHEVVFKVTQGGGTLNSTSATQQQVITDGLGVAAVDWHLGGTLGVNLQRLQVNATDGINDLSGSPMIFQATAIAGTVDPVVSTVTSDQTAVQANGQEKATITVTLTDKFGNPIPGKAITLVSSGTGNVFVQPQSLTNEQGQATGTLTSIVAETKIISARIIGGIMLEASTEVSFIPEPPERVTMQSGNNQTTNVGTAVQSPIQVVITDRFNNPVPGVSVKFEVQSGGGRILKTNAGNTNQTTTDSQGIASATWIVGPNPSTNTVTARALFNNQELSGSPVTFTAVGAAATASQMTLHSGTEQGDRYAGFPLGNPLEVKITDAGGKPVAGASVTFNVTLGGGSVSKATALSDHYGIVSTVFTLGPSVGTNEVQASNGALNGSPIFFRFESQTGGPSKMVRDSGNEATATVNATQVISVKITDLFDNPVGNVNAKFEVIQGGGSVVSSDAVSNSVGIARATILMPQVAGAVYVRASSDALPGFFVTFKLYATAGSASGLSIFDGNNQEGTAGRGLVYPLRVKVADAFGNPVSGVEILWLGTIGGGSVSPDRSTTNAKGIASASFNLGVSSGTNKASAFSSISLSPSQVEFTAIGVTNQFPLFTNLSDKDVTEGTALQFNVVAEDADGDPVTYSADNVPAGASFDAGTGSFSWTPGQTQQGVYEVTFIARDNRGGLDAEIVKINVLNFNNPPKIISFEPAQTQLVATWRDVIHFSVVAEDADNDGLTYAWRLFSQFSPSGQLLSTSQAFDFDTAITSPATDSIRVIVSDTQDSDTLVWELSVFTSVELATFSADFNGFDGVKINWETSREQNNAGFNILRGDTKDGEYVQLNEELLPSSDKHLYNFADFDVEVGRRYYYKLEDVDVNGVRTEHGPININVAAPETFELSQNYPNPFNPSTKIRYQLPKASKVVIRIYDTLGREVKTLVDDRKEAGFYVIDWDSRNKDNLQVASGIYYYTIQASDFKMTRKMLLIK